MTVELVPLSRIVRCRWRDEEDSPEKIQAAIDRISRQGFRGHLTGRALQNGDTEQLNGHNRVTGLRKMGWTEVPMEVREYTDEAALDVFLSDNMQEDAQSAGWALGVVRRVTPFLVAKGMSQLEAEQYIANKIGLDAYGVQRLEKINEDIDAESVTSEIKRILSPYNIIEYRRKLQELQALRPVSIHEQNYQIEELMKSRDIRGKIRTMFGKILQAERPERSPRYKAAPVPPEKQLAHKLDSIARTVEAGWNNLSQKEQSTIRKKVKYIQSLTGEEDVLLADPFEDATPVDELDDILSAPDWGR